MPRLVVNQWLGSLRRVFWLVVLIWTLQAVNSAYGMNFNALGIYPRDWQGLSGIFIWPLLHANVVHLLMNTVPLLIFGFFVALRGTGAFIKASLLIVIVGGLGVWIFGRPAYHIGASGLVFGYLGFLLAIGIYEKRLGSLLVGGMMLFYYGGMIFGVLPQNGFVSWEGHLSGLLAGVLAARLLARPERPEQRSERK